MQTEKDHGLSFEGLVDRRCRVRIADCLLDFATRSASRPGAQTQERVGTRILLVAYCLAEETGQVVSRRHLLERAWPGMFPTDDVLAQAIKGLRALLDALMPGVDSVQTVRKSGYRLLVPATIELDPATMPAADATSPLRPADTVLQPGSARRRRVWPVITAAMAALAVIATWQWWERPRPPSAAASETLVTPLAVLRIASSADDETDPRWSPGGDSVVYAVDGKQAGLRLQPPATVAPSVLTVAPAGMRDLNPAWHPDGQRIAFQRIDPASACQLWLVDVATRELQRLGECGRNGSAMEFTPDGGHLIGSIEDGAGGLSLARRPFPNGGEWQPLTYGHPAGQRDIWPRIAPDGRLGFVRVGATTDALVMPGLGGTPQPLTQRGVELSAFDWTQDGEAVLVGTWFAPLTWAQLARGDQHGVRPIPLQMPVGVAGLDAGRRGILVEVVDEASRILKLDTTSLHAIEFARASGNQLLAQPSPDGTQVAYLSDQSGALRVWVRDATDQRPPRMVSPHAPIPRHPPQWSEDGRRVVFSNVPAGARHARLLDVDLATGIERSVALPGYDLRWGVVADDGRWWTIAATAGERSYLFTGKAESGWLQVDRGLAGVMTARKQDAELWVSFARHQGVHRVDADLRTTPQPVAGDGTGTAGLAWVRLRDGLWWLQSDNDGSQARVLGPGERRWSLAEGARVSEPMAGHGRTIYLTELRSGRDIALVATPGD